MNKTAKALIPGAILLVFLAAVLLARFWRDQTSTETYPVLVSDDIVHAAATTGKTRLAEGKDCSVTVLPEHGYRVAFVWMDTGNGTIPMAEKKEHVYHGSMPASHVSIRAMVIPEGVYGVHVSCDSGQARVRMEPDTGSPGDVMTLTVTIPEDVRIRAVRSQPESLSFDNVRGSGVYTFTMPEEDVELTVSVGKRLFTDVGNTWYENYVYEAVGRGYMSGTGEGRFDPELSVTRAQAVQALYAMAGSPDVQGKSHYSDVANDRWYARAIVWAAEKSILSGYEDGTFCPDQPIVREQMAYALHNYVTNILEENASERSALEEFSDVDTVSQYALASVRWAVARGILSGLTPTTLEPGGLVPRCQMAAMLLAMMEETPAVQLEDRPANAEETKTDEDTDTGSSEDLKDIPADSWYREGVEYAVEKGYMEADGSGQFQPNNLLTRQQAIRILYVMEGEPAVKGEIPFSDVSGERSCADAILWGTQNGFISGYIDGTFHPDDGITREQFVAMLYKYAFHKEYALDSVRSLKDFQDGDAVASYAEEAMRWAVKQTIVLGSHGYITPNALLTRAQVACMIHTFDRKAKTG